MMYRTSALVGALALLISIPTAGWAASRGGISLPDSQKVGDKSLVLNGLGIRQATIFNVNVYVAGLYVAEKTKDPSAIIDPKATKRILMHFVRDVDASDIRGAYDEGFEKNAGKQLASMKKQVATLNAMMVDMKVGQRMSFTYVPGEGTTVNIRGKDKGTVAGDAFGKVLFEIFFGSNPPNSDLKEGMLGKKS